jgi:drug/metabolite transporter (DMT)-like permease
MTPTRTSPRVLVHLALLVVQLAFASQTVEGKIAMKAVADGGCGVDPWALAMARMAGAAVFFAATTGALGTLAKTTWRDRLTLAGLSVLGIALNQTLFLIGLRSTTPVSAALLSVTIPIFTAALAVVLRVERPSLRLGLGLLLALGGVVWLTGVRDVDRGAVLVSLNSLSYSLYIVLSRRAIQRLGAITVVTWIFIWGALLFAPVGVPALAHAAPGWSPRAWGFVAYIVLAPTIVAYACNAWALGRSSPTLVTIYIYLQPMIAALLARVQLGQSVSPRLAVAAACILTGVAVVSSRGWGRARPATTAAGVPDP